MSDNTSPSEKMSSLGAGISGVVNDMLNEARPAFQRMAEQAQCTMHDMAIQSQDEALDAKHQLEKGVRHVRVTAEHYIQHAPIRSVLIAAGTGAATALAAFWLMRSNKR
jgi:ElaB/YqjD/DUF883 family membrane-anchored ribosome-binding protein